MPPSKDELLRSHELYDDVVSIVSAFQFLFSEVKDLASTVAHFERYPKVKHPGDGNPTTPDFSVLFKDGSAMVGEIARFPNHDSGVDRLCKQILRYDNMGSVPCGSRKVAATSHVDVLLIVPFELGTAAIQRVLKDRALNTAHAYAPASMPCVIQFSKDHGKYRFQRLGDSENGHLREGKRIESIGQWLQRDAVPVAAERFRHIKSEWRFANDPTDPRYLAMHLWLVEFAELSAEAERIGRYWKLEVSVSALTKRLRGKYGRADAKEVTAALQLLKSAQLADRLDKDIWTVAWGEVARKNDEDSLLDTLADRASRHPRSGPITSIRSDEVARAKRATQERLFE